MTKKNEEISLNQIPATSKDVRKEMLEKMREIYPALFGEGNTLNAKELQALVDDYSKPEVERYAFPWTGKTASKRFAFTPSKARLVPDKDRSVDFDTTQNLIIEGENLEVLKLLQSSYFKKVKMIYIDPPYNTGHDFVYPDDYSESKQAYWEKGGVMQEGVRVDTNTESSGRYHSNWLSMMQSRLLLARNLLRDDGIILVSINDVEIHNLRRLMDEVFGEDNFFVQFIWNNEGNIDNQSKIKINHEYIVCYSKNSELVSKPSVIDPNIEEDSKLFNEEIENSITKNGPANPPSKIELPVGFPAVSERIHIYHQQSKYPYYYQDAHVEKHQLTNPVTIESGWSSRNLLDLFIKNGCSPIVDNEGKETRFAITDTGAIYIYKRRLESQGHVLSVIRNVGTTKQNSGMLAKWGIDFSYPKPIYLIQYLSSIFTKHDDLDCIVLDFFAGSGTTAHSVMELNKEDGGTRKFILVQLPEATEEKSEAFKAGYKTISQITIERVKRAGAKIKEEKPEVDTGFKTLRLAKSLFPQNMFEVDSEMSEEEKVKAWETYLEKSKQAHLFDFKPDELLAEILLKDGFDLNFKAEPMKEFKKNKVLDVSDGEKTALVCLDQSIHNETVKSMNAYKGRRFICLERSVDSTRKWNLKRTFGENLWVV